MTLLSKDTPSPFIEKDAEVAVAKEESKKNTSVKKEETRKEELATSVVKIDFDGITDRVVKLPVSPSYYGNFIQTETRFTTGDVAVREYST